MSFVRACHILRDAPIAYLSREFSEGTAVAYRRVQSGPKCVSRVVEITHAVGSLTFDPGINRIFLDKPAECGVVA